MAPRIVWTDGEQEKLALGTAAMLVSNVFMSFREAFDETQRKMITPSRQRVIASLETTTPWLRPAVEEQVTMLQREQRKMIAAEALGEASPEELMASYIKRIADISEKRALLQLSDVLDLRVEEAVEAALEHHQLLSKSKQIVMVESPTIGLGRHKTAERKRPTIVVVGPLNSQMTHVKLATEGLARLRFVDKDKNPTHSMAAFKGADFIVGMTKFLNHGVEDSIKSIASTKGKYKRFPGGIETLTAFIKGLVPEHPPEAQAA